MPRQEDANKAVLNRFWDEAWTAGRLAVIDEIFHRDFVDHGLAPGLTLQGPEGAKEAVTQFRTAFPDLRLEVNHLVAEGDKVFTYWTARGTHKGPLRSPGGEIPPTGKTGVVHGMTINRLVEGRIIEAWDNFDMLGMLQQLGVIPPVLGVFRPGEMAGQPAGGPPKPPVGA